MKIAAALLLSLPAFALAQQIAIGTYGLPCTAPTGITAGPDGALWFTAYGVVGRITTAGAVTTYTLPGNDPPFTAGITQGPDGALWFPYAGEIGRITTSGAITGYSTQFGPATGITTGPDGALWFTLQTGHGIGRITTEGVVSEFPVDADMFPVGIAAGADGALWFTEWSGNGIGRITTSGAITYYTPPSSGSYTSGITAGPDGALWFTEWAANNIGRITTAGVITEYPIPTASSGPSGITVGPDGALWFAESQVARIGRITTAGAITEYAVPGAANRPNDPSTVAAGPDGELWFADAGGIGEAVFVSANLTADPPGGYYNSSLDFAGSGFAAGESVTLYTSGVGSAVLASATADSTGSFSVTARAPQSVYGPRIFLGVGQSSGKVAAASFSMSPRLILNPTSGAAGSKVTVAGYGFGAPEAVEIYWNNPRTLLGSAVTDQYGTFSGSAALTFTVPAGAPAGKDAVFGQGGLSKAIGFGAFTVP